jgi:hypothetical protein
MTRLRSVIAIGAVLAPLWVGTLLVFPTMDDGWISAVAREGGREAIQHGLQYRPLGAFLFSASYQSPESYRAIGLGFHAVIWSLTAYQTMSLWIALFPTWKRYKAVVACLSIAPVVALTQLTTVTTLLLVNVPAILGQAAALIAIRGLEGRRWRLALACACLLSFTGMLFSEYAVAPVLGGIGILGVLAWRGADKIVAVRRKIAVVILFAGVCTGYATFALTTNFSARPDEATSSLVHQVFGDPLTTVTSALTTHWRAIIGAPVGALSGIRVSWGEKSTLAAFLFGCLVASLLVWSSHRDQGGSDRQAGSPLWALLALVVAMPGALLPEIVRQGLVVTRAGIVEPFSSRFYVTALPPASCLTVGLILLILKERHRCVMPILVGILVGYATFLHAYSECRKQPLYGRLADALRTYVEDCDLQTLVVMPTYYAREYEMVYKVTHNWPVQLGKRLFIVSEERFPLFFNRLSERSGPCAAVRTINVHLSGFSRTGELGQILWVVPHKNGTLNVEPYCTGEARPRKAPLPPTVRSVGSSPMYPEF